MQQFVRGINYLKDIKNLVWRLIKIISDQQKWLCRKLYKKKAFFLEKNKKNDNDFKEPWKILTSLGIKSRKVNQPKVALKTYDDEARISISKMQMILKIYILSWPKT